MKIRQYKQNFIIKSKGSIPGLLIISILVLYASYIKSFPIVVCVFEVIFLLSIFLLPIINLFYMPRAGFLWHVKAINLYQAVCACNFIMLIHIAFWSMAYKSSYDIMIILIFLTVLISLPKMIKTYRSIRRQMEEAKKKRTLPGFDQSRWVCTEIINKQSLEKISGARPNRLVRILSGLYLAIPGAGLFLSRFLRKTVGDQAALEFVIGLSYWMFGFFLSELAAELAIFLTIRAWDKERGRPIELDEAA